MKLVAVSVIKNEADIIEACIRHAATWTDAHLVLDHDSTDGTRAILARLQKEGVRIQIYTDDALGNLQQERNNHLARLAARECDADWIVPLDADEFIIGPGREELEAFLAGDAVRPASIPLLNYYATQQDDASESNPAARIRYCDPRYCQTTKLIIPAAIAADPAVVIGKGSHSVFRNGQTVASRAAPAAFRLAHFALRSPAQQALRILMGELQKLSRGRAHEGLDVHYRAAFQYLAENPTGFFETHRRPTDQLQLAPIKYAGGPLRYTRAGSDWHRFATALVPFLEKLATSHGQLVDRLGGSASAVTKTAVRAVTAEELADSAILDRSGEAFGGFIPVTGWERAEGPVVESCLPVFHWALHPETVLRIDSPACRDALLAFEALTYSEGQTVAIELNGAAVTTHAFARVHQRERCRVHLTLQRGANRLVLRPSRFLQTTHDPRRLAMIFLSLRID